jgi:transcriptional regulator with XRE-family HTH domain
LREIRDQREPVLVNFVRFLLNQEWHFSFLSQCGVDFQLNIDDNTNMASFGELLRDTRRKMGISQRELAKRIEVDFSYISKLENDRLPPPSSETLGRIAVELGCEPEALLSAAKKLPSGLENSIASEPSALRFLQRAARLELNSNEWESMIARLDELRDHASDGSE